VNDSDGGGRCSSARKRTLSYIHFDALTQSVFLREFSVRKNSTAFFVCAARVCERMN